MARIARLLLVVGVTTWLAAPVQAQLPWQRQQPRMPEKDVSKTGTIESVNNMMIQVTTDDNQNWMLTVKPTAKVKITGKGNASSLVPGQTVSFSATLSGKKITEKISKLAVVSSGDQGPLAGGMGANAGPKPKPGSKLGKNAGADPADAGGPSDMTGEVVKVAKNRLSLLVNGRKQNVELADDVEVSFDLEGAAALSSVGPGAKIEFKGKGQGNFSRAMVDDVKIEVVPAESHGKHAAHKTTRVKSKKGADDLDAAGTDDDKSETKKPAHHTHKKPKPDADADADKPADSGDATKDK
jgi:hypothetical protein